jgi:hypothetical protein
MISAISELSFPCDESGLLMIYGSNAKCCLAARMGLCPPHDNEKLAESETKFVNSKMIIPESVAIQTELALESFENRDNSMDDREGTT